MRFLFHCSCSALLLLLAAPLKVLAFGETGHGMVCNMALQLVSDNTRQQINTLVVQSPYDDFGLACSWPDHIKSDRSFDWSKPHHYINIKRGETRVTPDNCPQHGCVLSAIETQLERLSQADNSGNQAQAGEPTLTRWQSLLFLGHHVADLHQPLHVSYADDLGGNRTAVYFYGEPNNLHGVWDFSMLTRLGYDNNPAKQQLLLQAISVQQKQQWLKNSITGWAEESAIITVDIYQHYKPGMLIDDNYLQQYRQILEQRIQQAAVRLAYLLDASFN
ncbi:S1/P1 nuclease [Chromatiaceae bacterium AAb-1]|nr:S1/P1 nuclease [Chromatiaceae bacterium AAb-1]